MAEAFLYHLMVPILIRQCGKNLQIAKLKEKGYEGLVEVIVCTLHIMHNAFRKGSSVGGFGEMAEQLDLIYMLGSRHTLCNTKYL